MAGLSGDVPGLSSKLEAARCNVPVMGDDPVESVVVVDMLPRCPLNLGSGSSLPTDLSESGFRLAC